MSAYIPYKHSNSQEAFNIVKACIQNGFYDGLHNHIRHMNNIDLNNLFNYVLNLNNHKLSMRIVNSLYNIESKIIFLNMYLDKIIKSFLNSNETKEDEIKICKDVINKCNDNIIKNTIKNIIKNITLEQFKKLSIIVDMNDNIKALTIYGNMDLINFINSLGYNYTENTIINFIIDILNKNENINFNILKWIVDNHKDYVNNNLVHIINNIKIFSENNNSYIIIDYIFYLMKITNQDIFRIFKKIIYNENELLFCYMSIKFFSKIKDFNYFEYACLFSNPKSDLKTSLIGLAYLKTELTVEKLDEIFIKSCKYNILSAIKWFTIFLPSRYINNQNQPSIIESGSIKPIVSPFYMDKKFKITQQRDDSECCVCLENKHGMIKLSCHTSHIVCSECFETAFNIKPSCPLCRSNINMNECIISL